MRKRNKFTKQSFLFLFWSFLFCSTVSAQEIPDRIHVTADTTWTKETPGLVFDRLVAVENGATLTIEKGMKVVFRINPEYPSLPGIQVGDGKLIVNGTREENVIFISSDDGFSLFFTDNVRTSFMRYAQISGGGLVSTVGGPAGDFFFDHPVVTIRGGRIHIENSKFSNSRTTEVSVSDTQAQDTEGNPIRDDEGNIIEIKAQAEIINSNFSNRDAVMSDLDCRAWDENDNEYIDQECIKRIYLKGNWFGHPFGPTVNGDAVEKGFRVSGFHYLDSWKTDDSILNPVIIIPGITGSAEVSGVWELDPILHTYDDLVESLNNNGYSKNKYLFEFPYDWRHSNAVTADKLKNKIQEVVAKTKIHKIDLVAHSMGGLVARRYIEGDGYNNDVDKLVALGTPHHGSPKSYLKWEAGEGFFAIIDKLAKHHFEMEALHNHYTSLYSYIQERVFSVKELLPDYDYLYDVSQGAMRSYPDNYPRNEFLEDLNEPANLEKLKNIDFTNITGVLDDDQSTISKIRVTNSVVEGQWSNGMPENFYDDKTDRGLMYDKGDEAVPEISAENISADEALKTNSTHDDLPTVAQCAVFSILTQRQDCLKVSKTRIPNILLFNIFSPIDIQVIAPNGKRVGKNFTTGEILNEIPGAYYSGFDTENEFLTIPNPLDGKYRILAQGTGDGNYRIETVKLSEDENNPRNVIESIVSVSGAAVFGRQEEKTVEVKGNEVLDGEEKDTEAPVVLITSPENKEYRNNQILPINFSVTDNKTKPENLKNKILLDGVEIESFEIDFALQKLGTHNLKIISADEAGNGSAAEINFDIAADIDSVIGNINHYFDLNLIKDRKIKNFLLVETNQIGRFFNHLWKIDAEKRWGNKSRVRLIAAYQRIINHRIDKLIKKIYARNSQIIQPAQDRLAESLGHLKFK